ncbi:Solute carrier family 43 member 3 [Takifugu flavidus]|uniref:Solute carrier family 43 member 3 n=1 Tax=Takifugu flavidus TaxID=433684 RepID=A0A5C6N247_9TELE|nr:Solute carrier family 43 member 3 [Takifugu flavidus]
MQRRRYWLTLVSGTLECLCFAGVVFGFPSLVFVLKEERYFSQLCSGVPGSNSSQGGTDCSRQDERFSLVFTVASFLNNFLCLPNGFLFDRFGTRVTRLLAICLYTTGTLLVAFSSSAFSELLFVAAPCLAVGGILLLLTNMQVRLLWHRMISRLRFLNPVVGGKVGNLFAAHRSTIITLYNGAFDSSSAVFFIIKHHPPAEDPVPDAELTHSVSSPRALQLRAEVSEGQHIHVEQFESVPNGAVPEPQDNVSQESEKAVSFKRCVLSWFFLRHLVWLSLMQLRHYFFIGTLNPTLNRLARNDPDLVSRYTNAFAITQLCGVLCAPWNGLIMDRHKGKKRHPGETEQEADLRSSCLSLFLTSLLGLIFSVCASVPLLPLQYLTFALQVINRSFLYGGHAAFISIVFPACHFGKLYGLVMSASALFSLLQYPCFTLVKGALHGDPFYVDVALTLLTLLVFVHPIFAFMHCRRLARCRAPSDSTRAGA